MSAAPFCSSETRVSLEFNSMKDKVKELEAKLSACPPDDQATATERVDLLNELSWELSRMDIERACDLSHEAQQLARSCGYQRGLAYGLRNRGVCDWLRADYPAALSNFMEALRLFQSVADTDGEGTILNNIGSVYYRLSDYASALDYYFKSLKLKQDGRDKQNESKALNNIGGVYEHLGDFNNALKYYNQSLGIKEQIGDKKGQAYTLSNIGIVHEKLRDYPKAFSYQLQSVKILEEAEDKFGHAAALQGVGNVCEKLEEYENALHYYYQSLEIREKINDREGAGATLIDLGTCLLKRGEHDESLEYLHRALAVAEEINSRNLSYQAHEALSEAYDLKKDYQRALEHHRAFHKRKEEVYNAEADKRITGLVTRFEVEKAEKEAEIYRLKNVELAQANQNLQRADEQKSNLVEQLRRQTEELDRQTKEDALTGLYNRRYLDAQLVQETERARRFKRDLTVVMADLDRFKQINDQFSHQTGDDVLRAVAELLKSNCRAIDVVARYGGEEFALLLIETSVEKGAVLCEKLRASVECYEWEKIHPDLRVTISMGLAGDTAAGRHEKLLAAADAKLYEAKQGGRNQVRF